MYPKARSQVLPTPRSGFLRVGAIRHAEDFAGRDAIRLVAGIVRWRRSGGSFRASIARRQPRPVPGFQCAEVAADQHVTRRRDRSSATAISHHRKRPRVQLSHMLVVAGCNRGDGSVKVLYERALEILRLKAFAAQRPVAAP